MTNIKDPVEKILVSEEQIKECVARLSKEIDKDYEGKEPLMVSVLSGSFMFVADLMRAVTIPAEISFIFASSYGSDTTSTGTVEIHAGKGFEPKGTPGSSCALL